MDGSTILHGVSLIFKRSSVQQEALQKRLAGQQDPRSPNYHQWLTPEQFARQFGLASNDVARVTGWLESEGFVVDRVALSRTQVSFTGSVRRIESVFGTEIHKYLVTGERHFANATEVQVPGALQEVILAVRNLDDFHPQPRNSGRRKIPASPNFTSNISGRHFLAPEDFATIYDLASLYNSGFDGVGEKIAVIGDSDITMSNIETFRSLAGLSSNDPSKVLVPNSGTAIVPSANEQVEAYLDLEWAGAVAKNASIIYVYVGNNPNSSVWDALQYAIDNNLAPVISTSFGFCEQGLGQATVNTIQGWAQQANAQGQTIIAAAGDSGAADCDNSKLASAVEGLAVDVPAAIPEVTGVGGTEFSGDSDSTGTTTYWNGTTDGLYGSALSYIPEVVWNDTANGGGLAAGGGGASTFFAKPTWQTGAGVPSDGHRDVPDISLNASPSHDPYLICDGTDETGVQACTNGFRDSNNNLNVVGGTSAGAPTFAGIVALLNQATGSKGLGNINSTLYTLAGSAPSAFHDVTSGDNKVPCTNGSTDCPNGGTIGFSAGPGYDQASGLGSMQVLNLATNWPGFSSGQGYSMSASPASVTICSSGQSATSTITVMSISGFSGTVTLSCSLSSSTAKMGCTVSPSSISLNGSTTSATATLTITTTASSARAGSSASLRLRHKFDWLGESGGIVLGCVSLIGFPLRQRRQKLGLSLLLFTLLVLAIGCGAGSSGTPTGNYTITVAGSNGSTTHEATVSATVQ
jgi:subtilase family serine protease